MENITKKQMVWLGFAAILIGGYLGIIISYATDAGLHWLVISIGVIFIGMPMFNLIKEQIIKKVNAIIDGKERGKNLKWVFLIGGIFGFFGWGLSLTVTGIGILSALMGLSLFIVAIIIKFIIRINIREQVILDKFGLFIDFVISVLLGVFWGFVMWLIFKSLVITIVFGTVAAAVVLLIFYKLQTRKGN